MLRWRLEGRLEVTRIQIIQGGDDVEYDLSPGEDLADFMSDLGDRFSRSRETSILIEVKRVKVTVKV
jgi:hypothetical protein